MGVFVKERGDAIKMLVGKRKEKGRVLLWTLVGITHDDLPLLCLYFKRKIYDGSHFWNPHPCVLGFYQRSSEEGG